MRFLCHTFLNLKSGKESKLQLKANLPGLEIKVCIPGFDPVQDQPADPRPERTPTRLTIRLLPRQSDATLTRMTIWIRKRQDLP